MKKNINKLMVIIITIVLSINIVVVSTLIRKLDDIDKSEITNNEELLLMFSELSKSNKSLEDKITEIEESICAEQINKQAMIGLNEDLLNLINDLIEVESQLDSDEPVASIIDYPFTLYVSKDSIDSFDDLIITSVESLMQEQIGDSNLRTYEILEFKNISYFKEEVSDENNRMYFTVYADVIYTGVLSPIGDSQIVPDGEYVGVSLGSLCIRDLDKVYIITKRN